MSININSTQSASAQSKYTFETYVAQNGVPRHSVTVKVSVPSTLQFCPDTAELEVHKYPTIGNTKIMRVTVCLHDKDGNLRIAIFHPADMWSAWSDFKSAVALIGGVL